MTRSIPSKVRHWVREFWADQMRRGNAPDLPDFVSIEDFCAASEYIARQIEPRTRP